jgi:hypothetical protein
MMTEAEKLMLELARQGDANAALREEVREWQKATTFQGDRAEKAEADNARLQSGARQLTAAFESEAKRLRELREQDQELLTVRQDMLSAAVAEAAELKRQLRLMEARGRSAVATVEVELRRAESRVRVLQEAAESVGKVEADNARLKGELKKAREFRAAFEKMLPILRKFPEFEKCYQAALALARFEVAFGAEHDGRNGTAILGEGKPAPADAGEEVETIEELPQNCTRTGCRYFNTGCNENCSAPTLEDMKVVKCPNLGNKKG